MRYNTSRKRVSIREVRHFRGGLKMRRDEYQRICSAVKAGEKKEVKHIVTHQKARVVGCQEETDFFEVEVAGERRSWAKEDVKEEA